MIKRKITIRKSIEINEFEENEVTELQQYITANVPHTILQESFVLSESPMNKLENFTIIYRILMSALNHSQNPGTQKKLKILLLEAEGVYNIIFPDLMNYKAKTSNWSKSIIFNRLINIINKTENTSKMNKIVDAFLIFGEKIELTDINKVSGIDLESDHGKEVYKDINKVLGR